MECKWLSNVITIRVILAVLKFVIRGLSSNGLSNRLNRVVGPVPASLVVIVFRRDAIACFRSLVEVIERIGVVPRFAG